MAFDSGLQRKIMGRFATGVTVVTTDGESGPHALTANAFSSLSLDPPLLLVAVDLRAASRPIIAANRCFAVNILGLEDEALSRRFAMPGPKDFVGLDTKTAVTGAPVLAGALGFLDCRLHSILPGGDHEIMIGEIVAGDHRDGQPLLYYAGKYGRLAE